MPTDDTGLASDPIEAMFDRADRLDESGQHEEAVIVFEKAKAPAPGDPLAPLDLALAHLRRGDLESALRQFRWKSPRAEQTAANAGDGRGTAAVRSKRPLRLALCDEGGGMMAVYRQWVGRWFRALGHEVRPTPIDRLDLRGVDAFFSINFANPLAELAKQSRTPYVCWLIDPLADTARLDPSFASECMRRPAPLNDIPFRSSGIVTSPADPPGCRPTNGHSSSRGSGPSRGWRRWWIAPPKPVGISAVPSGFSSSPSSPGTIPTSSTARRSMADQLEELYELDREVVCFKSIDEAVEKAAFYSAHDSARTSIAEAGHRRYLRDHRWEKRIQTMIAAIQKMLRE